jgi:hypothetical protein
MLTGITDSTSAITTTFSNGSDWSFLLVVSNGYETRSATANIPRAFANVHMSGCRTGGVAFGKFSGATENNPLFECAYPIVLNGSALYGSSSAMPANPVEGQLYFVVE